MKNTDIFPFWVKLGLWGINNKKTALGYFWVCILLSIISFILGFIDSRYFAGLILLLSAGWYWSCIIWIDKNAKWEK